MQSTTDSSLPNIEHSDEPREPIVNSKSSMPLWFKLCLAGLVVSVLVMAAGFLSVFDGAEYEVVKDQSKPPVEKISLPEPPIDIQRKTADSVDPEITSSLLQVESSENLYSESVVLETNSAVQQKLEGEIALVKSSVELMQGTLMEIKAQLSDMREVDNGNASDINHLRRSFLDFKEEHKASTPIKNPELPFSVVAIKQMGTLVQVSVSHDGHRRDMGLNGRWMDWKLTGVDLTGRRVQFTYKDQITRLTVSI